MISNTSGSAGFFEGFENKRWENNIVEWWYNPNNQPAYLNTNEIVNVIKSAAASWEAVGSIDFVYKGITSQVLNTEVDDKLVVGWLEGNSFETLYGNFGGYASVSWQGSHIIDGNIALNADQWLESYDMFDLQGLMTHEFGHVLGIDHSDDSSSIMYANPYHSYKYQAVLRESDIEDIQSLYPFNIKKLAFEPQEPSVVDIISQIKSEGDNLFMQDFPNDVYLEGFVIHLPPSSEEDSVSLFVQYPSNDGYQEEGLVIHLPPSSEENSVAQDNSLFVQYPPNSMNDSNNLEVSLTGMSSIYNFM